MKTKRAFVKARFFMLQSIFKQFKEAPTTAVAAVLVLAVLGLWTDSRQEAHLHRAYMKEQNALQVECIKEQTAAFVAVSERLLHIESRLEHIERNQPKKP